MDEDRLQEYIRSYQELLTEKGYDEKTLGGEHLEVSLGDNLEKAFRTANNNAPGAEEISIELRIIGKIGPQQDRIGFQFVFVLSPADDTITLRNLNAYNGIVMATIIPHTNSSIPSSQEVYETLKEHQNAKQAMEINKDRSNRKGRGLN